jgi:hypothetical protein
MTISAPSSIVPKDADCFAKASAAPPPLDTRPVATLGWAVKIAILIPIYGGAKPAFTACLANMIAATLRANINLDSHKIVPEIETMVVSLSTISLARGALFHRAEQWGADFSLWLDSDHVFPRNALVRLLVHQRPVVGCNYRQRQYDSPTAVANGKLLEPTGDEPPLQEVEALGLGLCLVNMRVLGPLKAAAEAAGRPLLPLFKEEWVGERITGEDRYFFNRLRAAGIPVHVDHLLSAEVGHIDEAVHFLR